MLEFSITELRYPGFPVARRAKAVQYTDGEVGVLINDMRSAKFTLSVYDKACTFVRPLEFMVYATYNKRPVFWGLMTDPVWDLQAGTVVVNALGPEFRMQHHYLRLGDDAINGMTAEDGQTDTNKGLIRVQTAGYNAMIQAANNIESQTLRGVPDLGIAYAAVPMYEDPLDPSKNHEVQRGDECWSAMVNLSEQQAGYDFEVEPYPWNTPLPYYAKLRLARPQGQDQINLLRWSFGTAEDNLENCVPRPSGSSVVTHAHVLSQDNKHRGTATALAPSARFGVWVDWDALPMNTKGSDSDVDQNEVLVDYALKKVLDYGEPPLFMDITLKRDEPTGMSTHTYLADYAIGDLVTVVAKKGYFQFKGPVRITGVKLNQINGEAQCRQTVSVVPLVEVIVETNGEQ